MWDFSLFLEYVGLCLAKFENILAIISLIMFSALPSLIYFWHSDDLSTRLSAIVPQPPEAWGFCFVLF